MFKKLDSISSISVFKSIGLIITDRNLQIQEINDIAKKHYSLKQIEELVNNHCGETAYFCNRSMVSEVEVNKIGSNYFFLLQPKKEIAHLCQRFKNSSLDGDVEHVLNSAFDGIAITDADGFVLYQNPTFEQLTGIKVNDLIGKNVKELISAEIVDQSITIKILKEKKPASIIQRYLNTGKKVLITGVPIKDKSGRIKKIVINTRDLTMLNNLEKEIKNIKNEERTLKIDPKYILVANDSKMKTVIERALRVAQFDSTVLIQGESGSGKEGVVNLIHEFSNRKNKQLVKINCGAIPEQLLESELFGYNSGAFSGASLEGKPGLLEIATGGTIFLDEIGEMPLHLQVKLLRVLQEFEFTRIGGIKPIKVDVRVITATNRDLEEMVAKGQFREDLYYRLNTIPIYVPPLRERKEDIIPLIYHFLNEIENRYKIDRVFSQEAIACLQDYSWPGNVRELRNLVERVSLMVNKTIIDIRDIQQEVNYFQTNENHSIKEFKEKSREFKQLKTQMEEFEKEILHHALSQFSSIRKAAIALGIDQSTLVRKKQKYLL